MTPIQYAVARQLAQVFGADRANEIAADGTVNDWLRALAAETDTESKAMKLSHFMTGREVANALGVPWYQPRNDRRRGIGVPYFKNGRNVCYRASDVQAYLAAKKQPEPKPDPNKPKRKPKRTPENKQYDVPENKAVPPRRQ